MPIDLNVLYEDLRERADAHAALRLQEARLRGRVKATTVGIVAARKFIAKEAPEVADA